MTDSSKFVPLDIDVTPSFIREIATYDYAAREYTFKPTVTTPLGTWPVGMMMTDIFGHNHTSSFNVIVQDLKCVNSLPDMKRALSLTYEVGTGPLVQDL
jgi:hypothetical protein